jgi:hypothetical protein
MTVVGRVPVSVVDIVDVVGVRNSNVPTAVSVLVVVRAVLVVSGRFAFVEVAVVLAVQVTVVRVVDVVAVRHPDVATAVAVHVGVVEMFEVARRPHGSPRLQPLDRVTPRRAEKGASRPLREGTAREHHRILVSRR